ncbi:hypothetical protein BC941DRAFT_449081 [Chlamydoabsidia padenii]|nr:hypothetical protein BC941DRAFT_449081 [Chlamydoabsidia padenii]
MVDSTSDPFFEQMCQALTPGLMTPLDDWTHSGLFDNFFATTTSQATSDGVGSLVQDTFLTSPCVNKDYLCMPSSPPQDLFNALSTPGVSPIANTMTESDNAFVGLIDSLVIPGTPSIDLLALGGGGGVPPPSLTPNTSSVASTSPLEMILTLDSPPINKKDSSLKRKSAPPAAALPVTSHITSASTPTFALKQPVKKRSLPTPTATTSSNATVSSELALKRQKNTDAARRSRQKKLHKMETLAGRVSDLESIHHKLMSRVVSLESDKSALLQKETDYLSRIQQLEADLALAQQKLVYPSS